MRILYGVCGEGFGHSSRAMKMITHLKKQGHEVMIVTYGQAYPVLRPLGNVCKVEGIHLNYKEGKGLSVKRTLYYNVKGLLRNIRNWKKIKKRVDKFSPDVCVSDMELLVPIIRRLHNLPLISFDNQHRLTHLQLNVPREYRKDYAIAKMAVNQCVAKADAFIILSFVKGASRRNSAYVVGPLLRDEVLRLRPKQHNYILVYMTKPDKKMLAILERIDEQFVVYGYGKKTKKANITFKATGKGFVNDLKDARAIIGSAGFTLMSEALYLKKPYCAIPQQGQFEQILNALFLQRSGMGMMLTDLSEHDIIKFLKNLDNYEKRLARHTMNPREALDVMDRELARISA